MYVLEGTCPVNFTCSLLEVLTCVLLPAAAAAAAACACAQYGNAETNNDDDGAGTMECVYFGSWNATRSGWCGGAGPGPWVMADLENGLWACNESRAINPAVTAPSPTSEFTVGMVKGGSANHWAIRAGDAQSCVTT